MRHIMNNLYFNLPLALATIGEKYPIIVQNANMKHVIVGILVFLTIVSIITVFALKHAAKMLDIITFHKFNIGDYVETIDGQTFATIRRGTIIASISLIALSVLAQLFVPVSGSGIISHQQILDAYHVTVVHLGKTSEIDKYLTSDRKNFKIENIKTFRIPVEFRNQDSSMDTTGQLVILNGRARLSATDGGIQPVLKKPGE